MESIGILFGLILALLFYLLAHFIIQRLEDIPLTTLDDPTKTPEFEKLSNTPHCPFCGSYDLKLVDDNAGVPWLKGKVNELDHYQCQHCFETFQDETWQDTKVYGDKNMSDD